jgi:DNA polymerase-3 subunit gamma/tau
MLTTGAFNALLKTLEEPPAHIIFILATTEPHKIPQTILSRCQRFDFKKISQEKMIERLKYISNVENIDVDDKVYVEISKLSSGCMRDALSILDQVIAYSDKKVTLDDIHDINGTLSIEKLSDFVTSIVYHEYKTVFEMIDLYDKQGKNFIKLTEDMLYFFRNVMLYENVPDYEFEENVENYKKIVQNSNSFDCLKFIKTINEFLTDMKKTSNQQIVFEIMIISLLHIDELKQKKCISDENENMSKTVVEKTSRFEKSKNEIESSTPIQHEVLEEKPSNKEKQPINELDVKLIEKLKKLENIRVNNTLCNFNKKEFLEYKTRIDEIRNLIINPDYSSLVSLIIDGELKAYGNGNFIFLYKSERMKNSFNVNIIKIDELLTETFKINCKAIAISNDEWNVIKEEFNSKKKQYVYIDEPEDLENYLKTVHEDTLPIENLFGEIIEYN